MNKLLLKLKSKIMAFRDMFKDDNDINEKSVVGFASFAVMVIFAIADIVTGYMGQPLHVNEFIYNSSPSFSYSKKWELSSNFICYFWICDDFMSICNY